MSNDVCSSQEDEEEDEEDEDDEDVPELTWDDEDEDLMDAEVRRVKDGETWMDKHRVFQGVTYLVLQHTKQPFLCWIQHHHVSISKPILQTFDLHKLENGTGTILLCWDWLQKTIETYAVETIFFQNVRFCIFLHTRYITAKICQISASYSISGAGKLGRGESGQQ